MKQLTENDVVEKYLPWIRDCLNKTYLRLEYDDAYPCALFGFLHAMRTYDGENDFRPYAARCIRHFLATAVRERNRITGAEHFNRSLNACVSAYSSTSYLDFAKSDEPDFCKDQEFKDFLCSLPKPLLAVAMDIMAGATERQLKSKYPEYDEHLAEIASRYKLYNFHSD